MKPITGWHVAGLFGFGFGTIIAVNLTLAVNAVQSFPGVEVKNSYVASQGFDAHRQAQVALGWDVSATLANGVLALRFDKDGQALAPRIKSATFGRATRVSEDQTPDFVFDGSAFVARVVEGPGNWNLRVVARAEDGTRFQQRIVVETAQ